VWNVLALGEVVVRVSPALVVLGSVLIIGCSSRERVPPPGADAGRPPPDDAAGPPADAGRPGADDAGGRPDGARDDAGAADDGGPAPSCSAPTESLGPEMLPRCARATQDCVAACPTTECIVACFDADTTPPLGGLDCEGCIRHQQRFCIDMMGCRAQVAALECCLREHCPGGSCITTTCAAENTAWEGCARTSAAGCLMPPAYGAYYGICYAGE
jgi:hypothetical protein